VEEKEDGEMRKILYIFLFSLICLASDGINIPQGISSWEYLRQQAKNRAYWHPAVRDVKRVALRVYETYENFEAPLTPKEDKLPYRLVEFHFLQEAGLEVPRTYYRTPCQARMYIYISYEALGREYPDKGFLYTGAHIKGKIRFKTEDGFSIERDFEGIVNPPVQLPPDMEKSWSKFKDPNSAPFWKAVYQKGSFYEKVCSITYEAFGIYPLLQAYFSIKSFTQDESDLDALEDYIASIGEPAAKVLLALLREDDPSSFHSAKILIKMGRKEVIQFILKSMSKWPELLDLALSNPSFRESVISGLIDILEGERGRTEKEYVKMGGRFRGTDETLERKALAIEFLKNFKEKRIIDSFTRIFLDETAYIALRNACATALSEFLGEKALPLLADVYAKTNLEELRDKCRYLIEKLLEKTNSPEILFTLYSKYFGEDSLRYDYSYLNKIKERIKALGPRSLPYIVSFISNKKENPKARKELVMMLRDMGSRNVAGELIKVFIDKSENSGLRYYIGTMILNTIPKTLSPYLIQMALDKKEDISLRGLALKILEKRKESAAIKPCLQLLMDKSEAPYIRAEAAALLGSLKVKEAIEPLRTVIKEEDNYLLLYQAVISLGELEGEKDIELLFQFLKRKASKPKEPNIDDYIPVPPNFFIDFVYFSSPFEPIVSWMINLGEKGMERLREAMKKEDAAVRYAIIQSLRRVPKPYELLITALNDEDLMVRIEALNILVERPTPLALEHCLSLLGKKEVHPLEKLKAIEFIEKFKDTRAIPYLIELLNSEIIALKLESYRALVLMLEPATVEHLIPFIKNSKSFILEKIYEIREKMTDTKIASSQIEFMRYWAERIWTFPIQTISDRLEKEKMEIIDPRIVELVRFIAENAEIPFAREGATQLLGKLEQLKSDTQ
jgi:HEAT repeat protein